ncbi:MAG: AAA family ATPase, partial [Terriglobales bacterium]
MATQLEPALATADLQQRIERFHSVRAQILAQVRQVIVGQEEALEQILIALCVGGHCLITGLPGTAKTLMVRTISETLGLEFRRIQFTPDLMPSDITGTDIIEEDPTTGRRRWTFVPGPIFGNVLLADEINRTPPKTQSALLEAMQERACTVRGHHYDLPAPFFVLATQNPIELEGTYPLPEAQLDRFLLQIDVDYPDREAERRMLIATTGLAEQPPRQAMTADELMAAQRLVRRIPVGDSVVEAILTLVGAGRPDSAAQGARRFVAWGPG